MPIKAINRTTKVSLASQLIENHLRFNLYHCDYVVVLVFKMVPAFRGLELLQYIKEHVHYLRVPP